MCTDLHHGGRRCPSSLSARNGGTRLPEDRVTRTLRASVPSIAEAFHRERQENHRAMHGDDPLLEKTRDKGWIAAHGTNQANTAALGFEELPADLKRRSMTAASATASVTAILNAAGDLPHHGTDASAKIAGEAYRRRTRGKDYADLTDEEKQVELARALVARAELDYARTADAVLRDAGTPGTPLAKNTFLVEKMSPEHRERLAFAISEELDTIELRHRNTWDKALAEFHAAHPELTPGTDNYQRSLDETFLGGAATGKLLTKKGHLDALNARRSHLEMIRAAAEATDDPVDPEPFAGESAPKPAKNPKKDVKRAKPTAALKKLNQSALDEWDAQASELDSNDVNRAVLPAYGNRAEAERLLNGTAPLSDIAAEFNRIKELPATLKNKRGSSASRTERVEHMLVSAAAANLLTEAGVVMNKSVTAALDMNAENDYLIAITPKQDKALTETLTKHIIASRLVDDDEYDYPPGGTDEDRATWLIDMHRAKNQWNQGDTPDDAIAIHELSRAITSQYGRVGTTQPYNPAEHMDPLF